MKSKTILVSVLMFWHPLVSCNLDLNTTDTMCSDNIASSKKDGLYVCEYVHINNSKKTLAIKESWVEYCWRNERSGFKFTKKKMDNLQFNIMLEETSTDFKIANYFKTWNLEHNNVFLGLNNNLCNLSLNDLIPPDSIHITLNKVNEVSNFSEFENLVFVKRYESK